VIADALERFVAAFNANELDRVMTFFAPDAVYAPGDGRVHRGHHAIRARRLRNARAQDPVAATRAVPAALRPPLRLARRGRVPLDEQGRIAEKHPYANYGRPQIRRELGAA
jgi:hypothetical protein